MFQVARYNYVGPPDLAALSAVDMIMVVSRSDFDRWIAKRDALDLAEPFTFVVDLHGIFRLAPRRSEHVACAGGQAVLAAGEMAFALDATGWLVDEISNQSTGYCPDLSSWHAVAAALDLAGLAHPDGFTHEIVFRRCNQCGERNIVHDGDFVCAVCGSPLPSTWNFVD